MSNQGTIECDTVQIIEPQSDFLVDVAGTTSDLDERGELELFTGQTHAEILFQVPKISINYNFEYLYVDAEGIPHAGGLHIVPTVRKTYGFQVVFAAGVPPPSPQAPPGSVYVLHWRVTVVRTSSLVQVDAPESIYLLMPHSSTMVVPFTNPRSNTNYGFSELRVENLLDLPAHQAIIRVQVTAKTISDFTLSVNPTPAMGSHYFLAARTP
jgi:hypothetical protein